MNEQTIHTAEEPRPGQPIKASTIASIIRFLRPWGFRAEGIEDGDATMHGEKPRSHKPYGIEVKYVASSSGGSPAQIEQFSVFGAWGENEHKTPARVQVDIIGNKGSPLGLFTNGDMVIPQDAIGHAHHIDFLIPTRVRLTGNTPGVGRPCGVSYQEMAVTSRGFGLVCLSEPDDFNTIWVTRTREPVSIIGIVTSDGIQPFDVCGKQLGLGQVRVQYATADGSLYDAVDPATGSTPWIMDVFNAMDDDYGPETIVRPVETLGVGLVLSNPAQVCGSSSSSGGPTTCIRTLDGALSSIPGWTQGVIQILGHDANGCLHWYDVGDCGSSSA